MSALAASTTFVPAASIVKALPAPAAEEAEFRYATAVVMLVDAVRVDDVAVPFTKKFTVVEVEFAVKALLAVPVVVIWVASAWLPIDFA